MRIWGSGFGVLGVGYVYPALKWRVHTQAPNSKPLNPSTSQTGSTVRCERMLTRSLVMGQYVRFVQITFSQFTSTCRGFGGQG